MQEEEHIDCGIILVEKTYQLYFKLLHISVIIDLSYPAFHVRFRKDQKIPVLRGEVL
jgi:hypothetical protein